MDDTRDGAVLPPGQFRTAAFQRFGLGRFARYRASATAASAIEVRGDVECPLRVESAFDQLPRIMQRSDLHCVTTWSYCGIQWGGVRFRDFYEKIVVPGARPHANAGFVVFRAQDGYATSLPLEDLLSDDVMLADWLDGKPLSAEHGAPLRLVAPAHYGYKNVKHLCAIEFWTDRRAYRFPYPYPSLMDHPRARVALEERGRFLPAWLFRLVYSRFIPRRIKSGK